MVAFYTYFNPEESLLYSTQCLFPLALVVAGWWRDGERGRRDLALGLFVLLLAWHNTLVFRP